MPSSTVQCKEQVIQYHLELFLYLPFLVLYLVSLKGATLPSSEGLSQRRTNSHPQVKCKRNRCFFIIQDIASLIFFLENPKALDFGVICILLLLLNATLPPSAGCEVIIINPLGTKKIKFIVCLC